MKGLSKSKYTLFCQCPKAMWLRTYKPEVETIDPSVEARYEQGNEVGDLAMEYFGSYVEVTTYTDDELDLAAMIEMTKREMKAGTENICEASFSYHKGILPHSLSFTTDLHSMGQYVQDGERLMFETVISVAEPNAHVSIPADDANLDGINYLLGKSLTEINHNAEKGTVIAHRDGGVPVIKIEIPCVDEYVLGQLIYFFEFACGVSGYTLGVNPFDQPGVEAYKKNMFILLGKPGYEGMSL